MALNVILPDGKSFDLDGVTVIRTVEQAESDAFNARTLESLEKRLGFDGVVPSRRWTVVLEKPNDEGRVRLTYTTGSVESLVKAAPDLAKRFVVIDNGRSAIAATAKAHLIRPLPEREDSANRAIVYVEGGSSNGLYVTSTAGDIKAELGVRAAHLTPVGKEGFIDRSRIENVAAFDPSKELAEGQQRFTVAVRFLGVSRPQFFVADEATLRGTPVLDLRGNGAGVNADSGDGRPKAVRRAGTARTPEVR